MEERQFVLYGDSANQVFNWLTPYIEQAGYCWRKETCKDSYGREEIGKWAITITPLTTPI